MVSRGIFALSLCLATVFACSKKVKNKSTGEYSPVVLSDDAVPVITVKATRPDGGLVEGKAQALDPEVAEARKNKNMVVPIVFGKSVANITMSTKRSEAYNTLVFAGENQGVEFFSEHIVVVWGDGDDPTPLLIGIQSGYVGSWKLPAPYGTVTVGQKMGGTLNSPTAVRTFALNLGAFLESQPATYNCEVALTCQFRETDDAYIIDYKFGGIRFEKTTDLPLSFIYFSTVQKFYPRATEPIVFNQSIAGATFTTKQATFEAKYGPATASDADGFLYYDQESVLIAWGGTGTPAAMQATGTYQGVFNFGGTIGSRKIGDSFATYAATNNDLIKLIYRLVNGVADVNYDCLVQATCSMQSNANFVNFVFGTRASMLFTNTTTKNLVRFYFIAP